MARATSAIALGPACLNPYMLHPVEIAGQIAALDAASNGRAFLGLARGSWLGGLGIDQRDGPEAVAEAAAIVAALLKGDRRGIAGSGSSCPPGAALRQRPLRGSLPLLIGTWGPRLARVAGAIADEVKIGGSANPAMVPLMRQWVELRARRHAGRPADAVAIVVGAVTVVDEDGSAGPGQSPPRGRHVPRGRRGPRPQLRRSPRGCWPRSPRRSAFRARRRRPISFPTRSSTVSPSPARRTPSPRTPWTCFGAGADRIEFGTPHGTSDDHGLELLGARVLPAIREAMEGR